MAKYVVLTLILAGTAIGITLYFMKGIEGETKKPEEPAVKSEQKHIANTPKKSEQIETKSVKPVTNEIKETPLGTEPKAAETDASAKLKELKNKLDLLIKAGLAKAELEKVDSVASAEKTLIPDLIKKISTDSAQNDALMDVGKFKESKLKEGETMTELPKMGESKTLDDGTVISKKDEYTISVKTADKEDEYPADNFLFFSDKDGKNSFRIIEDAPKIGFSERLKAYIDTMTLIVGKDKALQLLDEAMSSQWEPERKSRLFDAKKLF